MFVTPAITAPESRMSRKMPDSLAGIASRAEPKRGARHGIAHSSLIPTGTPRSGPSGASSSICCDRSGKISTNAFS
jgi:hypothetical protein